MDYSPISTYIKPQKTKRLSPYSETEIWDKNEFLSIIKYEAYKRNKAALVLMWDLNASNHEIILLKIKNIRLKEKYGLKMARSLTILKQRLYSADYHFPHIESTGRRISLLEVYGSF